MRSKLVSRNTPRRKVKQIERIHRCKVLIIQVVTSNIRTRIMTPGEPPLGSDR